MKKILVMDEKNYSPDMDEIFREAVRGIIFFNGKLLMIENSFGETKLPGGGIEKGENEYQAWMREVKEETGYDVIYDSIRPFGEIEEKRLSTHEPMIWHQISRLYFVMSNRPRASATIQKTKKSMDFGRCSIRWKKPFPRMKRCWKKKEDKLGIKESIGHFY